MVRELQSMMPVEGGYYHWIKPAFGPFAGFMAGWMNWVVSWVDVAIYPVLAAYYLGYFIPALREGATIGGVEVLGGAPLLPRGRAPDLGHLGAAGSRRPPGRADHQLARPGHAAPAGRAGGRRHLHLDPRRDHRRRCRSCRRAKPHRRLEHSASSWSCGTTWAGSCPPRPAMRSSTRARPIRGRWRWCWWPPS